MKDGETRRVLIIDDERNLRASLAEFLALDGFACLEAATGEEGLRVVESEVLDAAVLDLRMPGMDGLEALRRIRESLPRLPVIMMSAHGDIADAVAAMKLGATDYLVKPFDPSELSVRLGKAIDDAKLIRMAEVGLRLFPEGGHWRGDDEAMRDVWSLVARVAPVMSTVLITGESGTGKEVVAREIHRLGPRSMGPFIPVNVSSIPESLLESELFGHEKGSFTGADSRKIGLFELASGGTLFLDEIGEIPPLLQVKLLRVLQDRAIMRVGGSRAIPIDVRIVSATNRDLEKAVASGDFREDFYFRLNVIRFRLPPLRERPGDIAPLSGLFLSRFAREMGKPITGFSPEALRLLQSYPFPGNIRELENCVERAVILCDSDTIGPAELGLEGRINVPSGPDPVNEAAAPESPLSVREAERRAIVAALGRNGGHRERTSAELGISRRTLLNKMKAYGLL